MLNSERKVDDLRTTGFCPPGEPKGGISGEAKTGAVSVRVRVLTSMLVRVRILVRWRMCRRLGT